MAKGLKQDMDYKQLIGDLENHKNDNEVKLPRSRRKYRVADFTIDNGDLKMVLENTMVRVVPKSERKDVLEEAHAGCMAGHSPQRQEIVQKIEKDRVLGRYGKGCSQMGETMLCLLPQKILQNAHTSPQTVYDARPI